jgi:hypothetical protein
MNSTTPDTNSTTNSPTPTTPSLPTGQKIIKKLRSILNRIDQSFAKGKSKRYRIVHVIYSFQWIKHVSQVRSTFVTEEAFSRFMKIAYKQGDALMREITEYSQERSQSLLVRMKRVYQQFSTAYHLYYATKVKILQSRLNDDVISIIYEFLCEVPR